MYELTKLTENLNIDKLKIYDKYIDRITVKQCQRNRRANYDTKRVNRLRCCYTCVLPTDRFVVKCCVMFIIQHASEPRKE